MGTSTVGTEGGAGIAFFSSIFGATGTGFGAGAFTSSTFTGAVVGTIGVTLSATLAADAVAMAGAASTFFSVAVLGEGAADVFLSVPETVGVAELLLATVAAPLDATGADEDYNRIVNK